MIHKNNCWWYLQPWKYHSDSGINPYDGTKIKITLNCEFWDYSELTNSAYFPFIHKSKQLILYKK